MEYLIANIISNNLFFLQYNAKILGTYTIEAVQAWEKYQLHQE